MSKRKTRLISNDAWKAFENKDDEDESIEETDARNEADNDREAIAMLKTGMKEERMQKYQDAKQAYGEFDTTCAIN